MWSPDGQYQASSPVRSLLEIQNLEFHPRPAKAELFNAFQQDAQLICTRWYTWHHHLCFHRVYRLRRLNNCNARYRTRLHSYRSLGTDQFWSPMVPTITGKYLLLWRGSVCPYICSAHTLLLPIADFLPTDQQPVTEAPPTCLQASEHATPTTCTPELPGYLLLGHLWEGAEPSCSPMAQPSWLMSTLPARGAPVVIIFDPVQQLINEWMNE